MNLYELTGELLELQDMLDSANKDEELASIILDTTDAVSGEFDLKVEGYAKLIKTYEADIAAKKSEAKRLNDSAALDSKKVARLKEAVKNAMEALGKNKSGGQVLTVTLQGNGGVRPLIVDVKPCELPPEFQKYKVEENSEAIRKALEEGQELDFARLGERSSSLRIK